MMPRTYLQWVKDQIYLLSSKCFLIYHDKKKSIYLILNIAIRCDTNPDHEYYPRNIKKTYRWYFFSIRSTEKKFLSWCKKHLKSVYSFMSIMELGVFFFFLFHLSSFPYIFYITMKKYLFIQFSNIKPLNLKKEIVSYYTGFFTLWNISSIWIRKEEVLECLNLDMINDFGGCWKRKWR